MTVWKVNGASSCPSTLMLCSFLQGGGVQPAGQMHSGPWHEGGGGSGFPHPHVMVTPPFFVRVFGVVRAMKHDFAPCRAWPAVFGAWGRCRCRIWGQKRCLCAIGWAPCLIVAKVRHKPGHLILQEGVRQWRVVLDSVEPSFLRCAPASLLFLCAIGLW